MQISYNHKPPVNWWLEQDLKSHLLVRRLEVDTVILQRNVFSSSHSCGCLFFVNLFLQPVNGSIYSLSDIWSLAKSSSNCFFCILLSLTYFDRLYLHSNFYTKSVCFCICI